MRSAPGIELARRRAQIFLGIATVAGVLLALSVGLPGEISERWDEFKEPAPAAAGVERFESSSGSGRYQLWQSALEANESEPLTGIGAGTFEYWWAREGTLAGFVRDAHSLYLETLAEVGIVGLVLLGGLLLTVIITGVRRSLSGLSIERRALVAGATAACVAFATSAAVDWVWELTVIPVVFMLLAAAILGPSAETRGRETSRFDGALPTPARLAAVAVAVVGIVAVAIPLAGATSVRDSQSHSATPGFRPPWTRRGPRTTFSPTPRHPASRRLWSWSELERSVPRRMRRSRDPAGAHELENLARALAARGAARRCQGVRRGVPRGQRAQSAIPALPMTPGPAPANGPGPETNAIIARLEAERPIPHPAFRGELRRRLAATPRSASVPRRLRLLITGYAAGGLSCSRSPPSAGWRWPVRRVDPARPGRLRDAISSRNRPARASGGQRLVAGFGSGQCIAIPGRGAPAGA